MSDLITRLSKLDAPDREVDGEIWRYLMSGEPRAVLHGPIPKLTASVDAAIALAARVLPGWNGDLDIGKPIADSGKMGCRIWTPESKYHNYVGEGFNSATALLIAILRAKEASNAE